MRALYALSGDPITFGHRDIIERAARTYERVVVGIGTNPQKAGRYTFTADERLALARRILAPLANVECVCFEGLLADFAYRNGIDVIVRGVRNGGDLEDELVLFAVNQGLHASVDTVLFPTRPHQSHISSSVVKAIVGEGGDVADYCPLVVKEALERKLLGRYSVGVAGGIGAGKSFVAKRLVAALASRGACAHHVDLDAVGHHVLGPGDDPIAVTTRRRVIETFGPSVAGEGGTVDRRALGGIVFADASALARLNALMHEPMIAELYRRTRAIGEGVLVIEGAILVEAGWTRLVNDNVVLVDAKQEVRQARVAARPGGSMEDALRRIHRQMAPTERRAILAAKIAEDGWGRIWDVANDGPDAPDLGPIAEGIVRRAKTLLPLEP